MLRIYVIIVGVMYMAITMVYAVEFIMTHPGSGWSAYQAFEYALRWPLRLI